MKLMTIDSAIKNKRVLQHKKMYLEYIKKSDM